MASTDRSSKKHKNFSITKGWTCLAGERSLFYIKQHISKGGRNMDKTVMERYTKYETETTNLVYNNTAADDQQHHFNNYQNKISTINDTEQVYFIDDKLFYDHYNYGLTKKINLKKQYYNLFNEFEMNGIFKTLLFEVKKKLRISKKLCFSVLHFGFMYRLLIIVLRT
jgi:hypothetical protein